MADNTLPQGSPPLSRDDYTIGWISALAIESAIAAEMLEPEYEPLPIDDDRDSNAYVLGRIGQHNVVMACINEAGGLPAHIVATNLMNSFHNVRYILMVGIGGGIPSEKYQIRLGDIVVSEPSGRSSGVVQTDFGKWETDGFKIMGSLDRPAEGLIRGMGAMKRQQLRNKSKIHSFVKHFSGSFSDPETLKYQGRENDPIYKEDLVSRPNGVCPECEAQHELHIPDPKVHYGIIASGNQVIKNREQRDKLHNQLEACCVEMEAFGLMNSFPCLVIRGISDYADGRKDDKWQPYAALTAAAYAKELLLQLSSAQTKNTPKMSEQLGKLENKIDMIKEELDASRHHQEAQRNQAFFDWLSPLKFSLRHQAICSDRLSGTGQWMLIDPDFRTWHSAEPKSRVLCCFGEPGAGKTFITSLVIDTLREDLEDSKPTIGLAYVYCDYGDQSQTIEKSIAAIVKQLLEPLNVVPETIIEIYDQLPKPRDQISLPNAMKMLRLTCAIFDRIYICIDALDEFEEREKLLESLQGTPPLVHLFITGRDHVKTIVRCYFDQAVMIPIKANESDVRNLIKDRIIKNRKHNPDLMDEALEHDITETIVAWSTENFLLSARQIDFVLDADTKLHRRSNLERLPKNVSEAFSATIERIQRQSETKRLRGMQILTWVYLAKRLLSVKELLHSLATEKGHPDLHHDNFISRNTFLDNCLGLVIMDEQISTVRLVHKSLRDYLGTQGDLFKNGHDTIAQTCLTYLMFQSVIRCSQAMGGKAETPKDTSNDLALVEYAACWWGHHLFESGQRENFTVKLAERYLSMDLRKRYWSQWHLSHYIEREYSLPIRDMEQFIQSFSSLHIAAYFGIHHLLTDLLLIVRAVDQIDLLGQTPLHWAARNGHKAAVRLLLEHNAEVDAKNFIGETALHLAASDGHEKMVGLLLEKGADVNAKDSDNQTPLHWAAKNGHKEIVELLLKSGASVDAISRANGIVQIEKLDVNERDFEAMIEGGMTALQETNINTMVVNSRASMRIAKVNVKEGGVNVRIEGGMTALHWAVMNRYKEIVELLLESGATVDAMAEANGMVMQIGELEVNEGGASVRTEGGMTVYVNGMVMQIEELDVNEGGVNIRIEGGMTALYWAIRNGYKEIVELLLESGAIVDAIPKAYGMIMQIGELDVNGGGINVRTEGGMTVLQETDIDTMVVNSGPIIRISKVNVKEGGVNIRIKGRMTALYWAIRNGYKEIVELLLKSGASVDAMAQANGIAMQIGELEVNRGGVSVRTEGGMTVLQETDIATIAVNSRPAMRIARVNVKEGGVNARIESGMTALYWANRNGYKEIVELLLESGATIDAMTQANGIAMQIGELEVNEGGVSISTEGGMAGLQETDIATIAVNSRPTVRIAKVNVKEGGISARIEGGMALLQEAARMELRQ